MAENQNPKVSVIVPVYNEIHFLDECINSIRNQTFKSIEIILVDDGSTNGAKDICDKFGKLDERVRVIHKQNQGLSKARYDGFCNAKGEWIMFCDHDDKIHCKMLEDFFKFYEDKKSPDEIEIISGQATEDEKIATENFDKEGDEESVGADCCLGGGSIILQGISLYNHSPKTLCPRVPTPLWGKIYKKKFLDKINLNRFSDVCPTIFLEDILMTPFLWCEAKKILAINRIYYFHRFVKTSVSRSHKLSSFYYEQITSGNILLQYLKNLGALFSYDGNLKLYMRTLLRIWCLTVFDKSEIRKKYEQQVLEMYNFYKDDYKKVDDNFWMKILILSFGKTKYVWRIFANQIYFKKNNREWMQRNKKIRGNSGWKNLKNHAANKN